MQKLAKFWEDLRSSLWFIPTLITLAAVALAIGLIELDVHLELRIQKLWPDLFGAVDGSREVLSAIAGSMITVAGVVFSITIVAFSLASSQYSPRVLHNFMRDRANQTVLGVFVGVFAYCLVVLLTIRGGDSAFIPSLAILGGVVLAFVGVGFLIYFIHHIANRIQASHILATAAEETFHTIDHLFPDDLGEGEDDEPALGIVQSPWHVIPARRIGYIQRIDLDALLAFACERQVVIRMERGIGEFVIEGVPLVSMTGPAEPEQNPADHHIINRLNAFYVISRQRTIEQDAGFGIRQIVDVALKGLSLGINDTTTAIMSVNYLTAILGRLARRRIASPLRYEAGELRVIARGPTFASLLAESFDQIRQNAEQNVAALTHLLQALETLAGLTKSAEQRAALLEQVESINEVAHRAIAAPGERARLTTLSARLIERLDRYGA